MRMISNILSHLLSFFKIDLLLLQSINKVKIALYLLIILSLIILEIIFPEHSYIIHFGLALFYVSILSIFFLRLKKENYFTTLSINRFCNSMFIEILSFIFPFLCFAFIIDVPYLIINNNNISGYLNILMVSEALCLVLCWLWKYVIAHIIISVFEFYYHFDINRITSQKQLTLKSILAQQHVDICMILFTIIIELIFVCLALKKTTKSSVNF